MGRPGLLSLSRSSCWVITVMLPQSVMLSNFLFGEFNYIEVTPKTKKQKQKIIEKCPWHTNMKRGLFPSFHPRLSWACLPLGPCVHMMICKGKDGQAT